VLDEARRAAPDPQRRLAATVNFASAVASTGDPADLDEAVTTARQAVGAPGQALTLANALRVRHDRDGDPADADEAEAAYRAAIADTEPVAVEAWLFAVRTLPSAAAYAHVRLGDGPAAAARLEWGRARLLTDVLERDRADLRALADRVPGLAARYRMAAARVRALEVRR
jgi:hypothetical protein